MKIKNYQLEPIHKVLSYGMIFTKSRIRNKFIATLMDAIKTREEARLEIIHGLCKKNKDKSPVIENDNFAFTPENLDKFNKEFQILQNEDNEIEMKGDIIEIIEASTAVMDDKKGETIIVEEVLEEYAKSRITKPKNKKD